MRAASPLVNGKRGGVTACDGTQLLDVLREQRYLPYWDGPGRHLGVVTLKDGEPIRGHADHIAQRVTGTHVQRRNRLLLIQNASPPPGQQRHGDGA